MPLLDDKRLPPFWVFLCVSHLLTGPLQSSAEGTQNKVKEIFTNDHLPVKKKKNVKIINDPKKPELQRCRVQSPYLSAGGSSMTLMRHR